MAKNTGWAKGHIINLKKSYKNPLFFIFDV